MIISYAILHFFMAAKLAFKRRGVVEGFFGPPWTMSHRAAIFDFGAQRGMNSYLYAPKDDPYHRERWKDSYPKNEWKELCHLVKLAKQHRIDFVYGFHPGKGLRFSEKEPVVTLLNKAERFYRIGVRTFAVLFDDIPSRLEHQNDHQQFGGSLARAEALWMRTILEQQPASWSGVEWWICPSYYTEDPLLALVFGSFEPLFLETLARHLPQGIACLWTGPRVVSKKITLAHVRRISKRLKHRLILWDNYPVNDLLMSKEMHLSPLTGRDRRLPQKVYGYLNNPLLQESLSFIPLATCFDYASNPMAYDPERSWVGFIKERFGVAAVPYWRTIRSFCERMNKSKRKNFSLHLLVHDRFKLENARRYLFENRDQPWCEEFRPWFELLERTLSD
ncbi:MAG TPA: beta-N-acetylglucosaminidase domain-containing protein [Candidatus Binatia bacterium]|jgi:hyaluronoglucosaminidase|nr:beta-N-acetylglucosaminidase domain-containing protein [Candidatus Binatia bacterium]